MTGAVRRWLYVAEDGSLDVGRTERPRFKTVGEWREYELRPVQAEQEEKSVSECVHPTVTTLVLTSDPPQYEHRCRACHVWLVPPAPPLAGMKRGWCIKYLYDQLGNIHSTKQEAQTDLDGHDSNARKTLPIVEIEYREITPAPPPPTPARCVCGASATVHDDSEDWWVRCDQPVRSRCWAGPFKPTRDAAIQAWNAMMERKA